MKEQIIEEYILSLTKYQMLLKSTAIVNGNQKFLIMASPSDDTMSYSISEMKKNHVTVLVRTCKKSYIEEPIFKAGIKVMNMEFSDGKTPSPDIIKKFMGLVRDVWQGRRSQKDGTDVTESKCIAIHCVAGLGRAPVLVGVALIEGGLPNMVAIQKIRQSRKAALNDSQTDFLLKYKKSGGVGCCTIF